MAKVTRCLKFLTMVLMCSWTVLCPYTKVEESFNIQAMHDILYHSYDIDKVVFPRPSLFGVHDYFTGDISGDRKKNFDEMQVVLEDCKGKYDHIDFPGVVPRTFIGPIIVSSIWYPLAKLSHELGINKMVFQLLARIGLGLFVCLAFFRFCRSVKQKFSNRVAIMVYWFTMAQFHFLFYASRPLPNTFALIAMLLACSCWLEDKMISFIWLSGFAIVVFRFELCMLAGVMLLISYARKKITPFIFAMVAIPAGIFSLGLTVVVDSYFWKRWVWPEGVVFYYNTVLNKSSNWGTLPFWWYFYSALPRALLSSLLFIPFGLISGNANAVRLFIPAAVFVLLFSFLPHKELRFIVYTFPMFNTVAAAGVQAVSNLLDRYMKALSKPFIVLVALCLLGNFCVTTVFVYASQRNYPGGVAFSRLHSILDVTDPGISVHVDNLATQTGVTRFGELSDKWRYSKAEHLTMLDKSRLRFTHLIAPAPCDEYRALYKILGRISAFDGMSFSWHGYPISINMYEALCILERRLFYD